MGVDYYPAEDRGIPMYGVKSFTVSKALLTQGLDSPIAGEINMLRALCKIEVFDKIANAAVYPDGLKYPRVTNVEMISWVDKGYIDPRYDDYASGLRFAKVYPSQAVTTPKEAVKEGEAFRLYCPEAKIGDMRFRVTAILAPGEEPRQFETSLAGYNAEFGPELVRNHIYRFNVHALSTIAELDVEVKEWTVETSEYELDNVVSVENDGFLNWTFDPDNFSQTYETYNGHVEQQLSILNGTTTYATGAFHLKSPKGAIWKAYFIPGENGVDAFEFVDVDDTGAVIPGSAQVYAEGVVGDAATIHIRGRGPADSYRHWAELVIEVKTLDGTIMYAPLTPYLSTRFIIYRENKL